MTIMQIIGLAVSVGVLVYLIVALIKPEGKSAVNRLCGGFERLFYRLSGIKPELEMGWKQYALALLLFNVIGILVVY
eukprot:gene39517-48161_t